LFSISYTVAILGFVIGAPKSSSISNNGPSSIGAVLGGGLFEDGALPPLKELLF